MLVPTPRIEAPADGRQRHPEGPVRSKSAVGGQRMLEKRGLQTADSRSPRVFLYVYGWEQVQSSLLGDRMVVQQRGWQAAAIGGTQWLSANSGRHF